jgi:hypothetical protein
MNGHSSAFILVAYLREHEDFTLPYRFQVESTWSQVDLWTPGGLSLAENPAKVESKFIWNLPGLHLASRWTMWTMWI